MISNFVAAGVLALNTAFTVGPLTGDVNSDGVVDFNDVNLVLANFGRSAVPFPVYRVYHLYNDEGRLGTVIWLNEYRGIKSVLEVLRIPPDKYIGWKPDEETKTPGNVVPLR